MEKEQKEKQKTKISTESQTTTNRIDKNLHCCATGCSRILCVSVSFVSYDICICLLLFVAPSWTTAVCHSCIFAADFKSIWITHLIVNKTITMNVSILPCKHTAKCLIISEFTLHSSYIVQVVAVSKQQRKIISIRRWCPTLSNINLT